MGGRDVGGKVGGREGGWEVGGRVGGREGAKKCLTGYIGSCVPAWVYSGKDSETECYDDHYYIEHFI